MKMTKISTIVFGLLIVLGGLSGCDVNNNKQNVYAIFPLSGNFAAGGKILTRTIDTYMKVHPQSNISIRYIDSQSDPAKAISAVRQGVLYEKSPITIFSTLLHPLNISFALDNLSILYNLLRCFLR